MTGLFVVTWDKGQHSALDWRDVKHLIARLESRGIHKWTIAPWIGENRAHAGDWWTVEELARQPSQPGRRTGDAA